MKIFVIVATKGRAKETATLFDALARQLVRPAGVIVVGSEDADVEGLAEHPHAGLLGVEVLLAPQAGAAIQRNVGLTQVTALCQTLSADAWCAVFFDDDFRPDQAWLKNCTQVFSKDPSLVGLTGCVLADGVNYNGFSDAEAKAFNTGERPPLPHWTAQGGDREIDCLYGCNMAFLGSVASHMRFDERLPLYSWQEDRDYSKRACRYGRLVVATACRGVHLGINNGRTSGLRFGYSQVANLAYLATKNSISVSGAVRFAGRNVIANFARTLMFDRRRDYPGRLRGNLIAMGDLLRGRVEPERILSL